MEPRADARRAWMVFAIASALLAPGAFFGLPPSAGKNVAGALRILDGEVIYRDFWTMYAPGQFYATAALFAVFGRDVLVQALAAVFVRAATVAATFGLVRAVGASSRIALAIAAVLAIASFETSPELGSYPPALLAIVCAWRSMLPSERDASSSRSLVAGLCLGAAACFKHDVAAYAFVACSVAAFASSRRAPLASVVRMAAGAAFVIVPVVAWLAWSAGRDAWVDLVAFPSGDFRAVRGESYPRYWPRLEPYSAWLADPTSLIAARAATSAFRNWTLSHAPEIAWIAIAIVFARARRELDPRRRYAIVLALAGIPIFWAAAHVQQNTHLFSMALLAALAAAASFGAQVGAAARGRRVAIALGLWYACGLWIAPAQDAYLAASVAPRSRWLDLPGARLVRVSRAEADVHRAIAEFVRANVPAGERIYCGVARHDAIVVGNQRWHMLAERAPAVRHGELHPGVTDREDVQRETIERLERHGVRCAVLWRFGWPDAVLDDIMRRRMERVPGTGATLLDRHLEQRFESVLEVGEYVVLWRKDAERPSR